MAAPKITLDTNCIINVRDSESQTATSVAQIQEIIRASHQNSVELAITSRVEADIYQDRNEARRQTMLGILNEFPVIGGLFRFDTSHWDNGDLWATNDGIRLTEEIQRLLFPGLKREDKRHSNKMNDVDHLVSHCINKRDIFVTDDKHLLSRSRELQSGFGIVVMSPKKCVEFIIGLSKAPGTSTLQPDDPKYHAREFTGVVTFDYSNNNGRFALGEGIWLFNTKWSKAGDTAIHAYGDGKGMSAIALAKNIADFTSPLDFNSYDFSSRARKPSIGQTVIWRNSNGQFAATKVLAIKDDKRGAPEDELTFAYQIFTG